MFQNKMDFKHHFETRLSEKYGNSVADSDVTERFDILGEMVRDYAGYDWRATREKIAANHEKQVIYFSMEFLIGRLLVNNMQNLGIYEVARDGLAELGIDINELEEQEADAGLGNGGLGRLAACFLDSSASLGYPVNGMTIRYNYGFFRQKLMSGKQVELPDQWLTNGYVFEVRKPKHAVEVKFYGNAETYIKPNGEFAIRTVNATSVLAMPYDVSVVGYRNKVANTLRLWSAEPSEQDLPKNQKFEDYLQTLKELCHGLYPDDSTEHGRILRLRQQYFLVSAGLQSVIREHKRRYGTLDNLKDKYVFQLNDTHPILVIPELMRLLMDEEGYGWDFAFETVQKCVAYTNHTVMQEALEKWPIQYVQRLIPRCFMIIEELNRRFNMFLNERGVDENKRYAMQIIKDGQIHMTNLAIFVVFSVNGVARLHTDILKKQTFKEFYELFPEKFNSKTNGVTHRRWLLYSNPRLANAISTRITNSWITNMDDIEKLEKFKKDKTLMKELEDIKLENKKKLAKYIKDKLNIDVDTNAIFDVQIKRLHAYKRQLMNIFHIMYLYQRMKEDPSFRIYPRVFIFGAKAAPSYDYAKKIIELILSVAAVVNNDPDTNKFLKIVYVENYGVSLAEKIIPAADVSEQISTAGKEASGTSNMKFMMNGAITLGTLDGANVEICERVGEKHCVIFGLKEDEVEEFNRNGMYNPYDVYNSDYRVKKVIDSLFNGPWVPNYNQDKFRMIFDEVMNHNDTYYILKDFDAYVKAQEEIEKKYLDKKSWYESVIINIAKSGYFSSDRTIENYVHDIWKVEKVA